MRAQRRQVNRSVMYNVRLADFTNPPIRTGNLDNYGFIPSGTIIQSAAVEEPDGWYDCDGRTLPIRCHEDLFKAIGYTYGGSGTSFNIPDMRGRVSIGLGDGPGAALTPRSLGATGGAETHTLILNEMPIHNHDGFTGESASASGTTGEGAGTFGTSDVADSGSHRHTIPPAGGNGAHNNMQPFLVLRYLIKA